MRAALVAFAAVVLAVAVFATGRRYQDARGSQPYSLLAGDADTVTIDIDQAATHPISPYIYGINFAGKFGGESEQVQGHSLSTPRFRLDRLGGNRFSAYNWETNYSNAGNDYQFSNDRYLSASSDPAAAVTGPAAADLTRGAAVVVTIPMLDYVAGDAAGSLDVADSTRSIRLANHFRRNRASMEPPFSATPDTGDGNVYQDQFLRALIARFPDAFRGTGAPIFLTLDNEPDLWSSTHEEVESRIAEVTPRRQTYDGFIARTIEFAAALKRVAPRAEIFGPSTATWTGMATLGRYPVRDPVYGGQFFLEVYLDRLRDAERARGQRLVDVLDVHWYPEMLVDGRRITDEYAPQTKRMIDARLQAPRSLWDCSYLEDSWVNDAAGGPICLLPRLRKMVATHYPGTRIAISEYAYGRPDDITGGIAQADALGIFGREGVFAAALWPDVGGSLRPSGERPGEPLAFAFGAFEMFLNYDGAGGRFGDTGLAATTSSTARTSVYASVDGGGRLVVILINKAHEATPVKLKIHGAQRDLRRAGVYSLTDVSPSPVRQADLVVTPPVVVYSLPALSVTTLVFGP